MKTALVNDRLYVFSNLCPENHSAVKVIDFNLRRLFPIQFKKYGPSTSRLNYSISNWKHKVYLYGGIDAANKVVESMDEFDTSLYKFQ
jgi:hypothetical protein